MADEQPLVECPACRCVFKGKQAASAIPAPIPVAEGFCHCCGEYMRCLDCDFYEELVPIQCMAWVGPGRAIHVHE